MYPWSVEIQVRSSSAYVCMGSLIADSWILTAAHCVVQFANVSALQVVAGRKSLLTAYTEGELKFVGVKQVLLPSGRDAFDRKTFRNDIALLKLSEAIPPSRLIKSIDLLNPKKLLSVGEYGSVAGFGSNKANKQSHDLKKALVFIRKDARCAYFDAATNKILFDPTRQLCAGVGVKEAAVCQGDSGAALAIELKDGFYAQAGIVSLVASGECESDGNPVLYTRVDHFLPFIRLHVAGPIVAPDE